jgi:hypothetical protein
MRKQEEKDKYYAPSLNELKIGFIYDQLIQNEWVTKVIKDAFDYHNVTKLINHSPVINGWGGSLIRVKKLTADDIIALNEQFVSLGELNGNRLELSIPESDTFYNMDLSLEGHIIIERYVKEVNHKYSLFVIFDGHIKNVCDLKLVFQQIGLSTDIMKT